MPSIRSILEYAREETLAGILNDPNVPSRNIIDLLYGTLLARIFEGPQPTDKFDISHLLVYVLQRCIDSKRPKEHHHFIRSEVTHSRVMSEIEDWRLPWSFYRLVEMISWLSRKDEVTMTSIEFYSTIPCLFVLDLTSDPMKDCLQDRFVLEMVLKGTRREDFVVRFNNPKVDVELDKLGWMSEFTRVCIKLSKNQDLMPKAVWIPYTRFVMGVLGMFMMITTLRRSSTIEQLSDLMIPRYEFLSSSAERLVGECYPIKKG